MIRPKDSLLMILPKDSLPMIIPKDNLPMTRLTMISCDGRWAVAAGRKWSEGSAVQTPGCCSGLVDCLVVLSVVLIVLCGLLVWTCVLFGSLVFGVW